MNFTQDSPRTPPTSRGNQPDLNIGPLADNGGHTWTRALLKGSVAVNAGEPPTGPRKRTSGARPGDAWPDIGAYEYKPVVYVDSGAEGANDGYSWAGAYADLKDALDAASGGQEIWVAKGTYKPAADADRAASFVLADGVGLYGGFAGGEYTRFQRDPEANPTVLSGDIGTEEYDGDNSYHVVRCESSSGMAVLDGFAITGGNADGTTFPDNVGGGLYVVPDGALEATDCVFDENSADSAGGGMYNDGANPAFDSCTFSGNSADTGGGAHNDGGSPVFDRCAFSGNFATDGAGMANAGGGSPAATDCVFTGNSAANSGGGMRNDGGSPVFDGCAFSANSAVDGAGMFHTGNGGLAATNCTFSGNSADADGGGMYSDGGSAALTNCTFAGNDAGGLGDGIFNDDPAVLTLKNTILADNGAEDLYNAATVYSSHSIVEFSSGFSPDATDIAGDQPDLNIGPLADNGGPTPTRALLPKSVAIDAGTASGAPATDQRGRPRDSSPDIGAFEYRVVYVDSAASGEDNGKSWTDAFTELRDAFRSELFAGDEIWVAKGTYKPADGSLRTISFVLKDGVALYGGFAGGETARDQRDWETNAAVLSGDIGAEDYAGDNSYHVVTCGAVALATVLDGFTISGGNADQTDYNARGGGMHTVANGNLTVANCTFDANSANDYGGGIYNHYGRLALTNCTFDANSADDYGGALYNHYGSPRADRLRLRREFRELRRRGNLQQLRQPRRDRLRLRRKLRERRGRGDLQPRRQPRAGRLRLRREFLEPQRRRALQLRRQPSAGRLRLRREFRESKRRGDLHPQRQPRADQLHLQRKFREPRRRGDGEHGRGRRRLDQLHLRRQRRDPQRRRSLQFRRVRIDLDKHDPRRQRRQRLAQRSDCRLLLQHRGNLPGIHAGRDGPRRRATRSRHRPPGRQRRAYPDPRIAGRQRRHRRGDRLRRPGDGPARLRQGRLARYRGVRVSGLLRRFQGRRRKRRQLLGRRLHGFAGRLGRRDRPRRNLGRDRDLQAHVGRGSHDLLRSAGRRGALRRVRRQRDRAPIKGCREPMPPRSAEISARQGDDGDNSYHVVRCGAVSDATILDGFTISGGNADGAEPDDRGGGLHIAADGALQVSGLHLRRQFSGKRRGGVANDGGAPAVSGCTFAGNSADDGGGLSNSDGGTATLTGCTFSDNDATYGGGMSNDGGSAALTNCTFSANSADYGGGMRNLDGVSATNCTFAGNSATVNGDGIFNDGSAVLAMKNTILADNGAEDLYNTATVQSSHNIVETHTGFAPDATDITGDRPDLNIGPLADNGGNTMTRALRLGSVAIDAGTASGAPATDQRGFDRDASPDIGAYECRTFYVDAFAAGANDGGSWADAFADPHDALDAASSGDAIWVASGTYRPAADADRAISFVLKDGVGLYGGFVGTETSLAQRDLDTSATVLSGDIGVVDDDGDNSYHVVRCGATTSRTVLDGFTIAGGHADGTDTDDRGGGLLSTADGNLEVANCAFVGNHAVLGGGMHSDGGGAPAVTGCAFMENTADYGGGMDNRDNLKIANCTFSGNSAASYGGGIRSDGSPSMTNCTFSGNSAASGGGMFADGDGSPSATNCTFVENGATGDGDGIFNDASSVLTLKNTILADNGEEDLRNAATVVSSHCIVETYTGFAPDATDISGDQPDLNIGPLAENGGDTWTRALLEGSVAIDAGTATGAPTTDQRGVARDASPDIGAFEYYPRYIYYVASGDCGGNTPCYQTIQEAIDDAHDGGFAEYVIRVAEGEYHENVVNDIGASLVEFGWTPDFASQAPETPAVLAGPDGP